MAKCMVGERRGPGYNAGVDGAHYWAESQLEKS